jgi:hypothetical protein
MTIATSTFAPTRVIARPSVDDEPRAPIEETPENRGENAIMRRTHDHFDKPSNDDSDDLFLLRYPILTDQIGSKPPKNG